ncbi:MAG: type II secretion system protein, partial [Verrucomicrobiales bacterium]
MTISAVRTRNDRLSSGFTLLEMIIVIAIMSIVVGGALSAIYFNRSEARLRNSIEEVELLAKRARSISALQQRPYALEVTPNGVSLMPYAEAVLDERDREFFRETSEAAMLLVNADDEPMVVRTRDLDGWHQQEYSTLLM